MELRGISKNALEKILSTPEQTKEEQGRKVYEKVIES